MYTSYICVFIKCKISQSGCDSVTDVDVCSCASKPIIVTLK